MSDKDPNIIELPDDALPEIDELTGDLRILAEIVGVRKALEIGQRFHGTSIRIWGVMKFVRRHRDRCMRRDADHGHSGIKLARKYHLCERQVWNILGSPEEDERQMGLFG